jgi:mannose-6-phosphate isomerase
MAIEHASVQVVRKPWGVADLHPWSGLDGSGDTIGELWFQRIDGNAPVPSLLFKLLFTSEPLSIQVHPDDAFARSIGQPNGKTEAWYILSAKPDARIALGLKQHLTPQELRSALKDGSIAELVQWRPVVKDDFVFVPAGTIHAIGAGIVLAEIQQRSDATFRLFDYDRQRGLHEDNALAVSDAGPAQIQTAPRRLTRENSSCALNADPETWVLLIDGHAAIGLAVASIGETIFIGGDRTSIEVGASGLVGLVAYPGPTPVPSLLENLDEHSVAPTGLRLSQLTEVEVRS